MQHDANIYICYGLCICAVTRSVDSKLCTCCRLLRQIIFEPYKTGFEEEKNFQPALGQIIAGRYRVVELLGQVRPSKG